MNSFAVLLKTKLIMFRAVMFERRMKYILRNIAMFVFLFLLVLAAYEFFLNIIFKYVVSIEDIGLLLIDRLVSVGFLIFFVLLIVSSFITALGAMFRSRETEYLFSSPVSVAELFTSKYVEIVAVSSWSILIMAVPILLAYAKIREFGAVEYVLTGTVVLVPYILIAASIGTLLALFAMYVSKRIGIWALSAFFASVFFGIMYYVISFSRPTELEIQFQEDFRALNLFINNFQLNANPFAPNYWFIQSMRAIDMHVYHDLFLYAGAMMATALFFTSLLYVAVDSAFFKIWLISLERSFGRRLVVSRVSAKRKGFLASPPVSQVSALIQKELLLFVRETGQWTQFFLVVVLVALYFFNLRFVPDDIEIEQWRTILFLMNFAFCGFVLSTLVVRFIYPSISLEGRSFWVLGSAPLSISTLFRQKFVSSFTAFFILSEIIAVVSSSLLKLEPLYQLLTFGGIFLMSTALSCIGIGFGAAFPDFAERNPSKIVSSPGGILTIVTSLGYLAGMLTCVTIPAYRYTLYLISGGAFPQTELVIGILIALVLNIIVIIIPLRLGARSFEHREF